MMGAWSTVLAATLAVVVIGAGLATGVQAQARARRASQSDAVRPGDPAPAILRVTPLGGHRLELSIEAQVALELVADRRLLHVDIVDARGRRTRCEVPTPAHPEARVRSLAARERWTEWLDVRELCWGRGLTALEGAREVSFRFDAGRRRGVFAVRVGAATMRALAPVSTSWRPPAPATIPEGAVIIGLAPSDGLRGGRPTLRVRITGGTSEVVRAFVRPAHVSFRVLTPSGGRLVCSLSGFEGRALPDFFSRLSSHRAIAFALDAVSYCGALEEPGVYEVTPVLTLTEAGRAWSLDAVTGTFVGAPAPLRLRSTTYVEQPIEERR